MIQEQRVLAELNAASGALGFAISTLERIQAGQEVDVRGVITLLGEVRGTAARCDLPDVNANAGNPVLRRVYDELRTTLSAMNELAFT